MELVALAVMAVGIFTSYTAATYRKPLEVLRDLVDRPEAFSATLRASGTWGRPQTASAPGPALGRTSEGTDGVATTYDPRNGRLPAGELATIPWGVGERVNKVALPSLVALNKAFRARFGRNLQVTDGYRTLAQQEAVRLAKPTLAAKPGYSVHGLGLAVDLGGGVQSFGTAEHEWMRVNGPTHGWRNPSWAQQGASKPEPWHWEFTRSVGGAF